MNTTQADLDTLKKMCAMPVSGSALKIAFVCDEGQLTAMFEQAQANHRVMDARDMSALDDKLPTIVTGAARLTPQSFHHFIVNVKSLRFRNPLFIATAPFFEERDEFDGKEVWMTFHVEDMKEMYSQFSLYKQVDETC